jgi:hypothetical protein
MTTKQALEISAITGIQSQEHTRILDAIDRMRDLGINDDLSIPQVCLHPQITFPNLADIALS